jgi:murein DD-endopeptidase MepM/ murein hydrolase activator NlpD
MTRILVIFMSMVLFCFQLAQGQIADHFYISESLNDSADLANNFYDHTDTNSLYRPATDLYQSWDNYLHSPKVDFKQKTDTTIIILTGGKKNAFCMPIKTFVTSEYGWRWRRMHNGTDIELDIGDSIKCLFDGVVRISEYNKGGYGNLVVVRHFNGLETYYAHMSVCRVVANQFVRAGELLGYGGSTGNSLGPHLHFETRYLNAPFNSRKFIDYEKNCLKTDTLLVCRSLFDNAAIPKTTAVTQNVQNNQNNQNQNNNQNVVKPNTQKNVYYYVKKGDTLSRIASLYHTSVDRLCQLNGISSRSILQIGQRVRVK